MSWHRTTEKWDLREDVKRMFVFIDAALKARSVWSAVTITAVFQPAVALQTS